MKKILLGITLIYSMSFSFGLLSEETKNNERLLNKCLNYIDLENKYNKEYEYYNKEFPTEFLKQVHSLKMSVIYIDKQLINNCFKEETIKEKKKIRRSKKFKIKIMSY